VGKHKVVLGFYGEGDAMRFFAETRQTLSVASVSQSFILRGVELPQSDAVNTINGPVTGTSVQCNNVDGGVHLG